MSVRDFTCQRCGGHQQRTIRPGNSTVETLLWFGFAAAAVFVSLWLLLLPAAYSFWRQVWAVRQVCAACNAGEYRAPSGFWLRDFFRRA